MEGGDDALRRFKLRVEEERREMEECERFDVEWETEVMVGGGEEGHVAYVHWRFDGG